VKLMTLTAASLAPIADSLTGLQALPTPVQVRLSHELVRLLSEQLYQSPLKAVEELVVNAYDADAGECRVFVPTENAEPYIVVFDTGIGMTQEGLANLWHIGRSDKRTLEVQQRSKRKQIGKFGIGKLATYTISNRLTYISRSSQGILSVTVDFTKFESSSGGTDTLISVPVHIIEDWEGFASDEFVNKMLSGIGINPRQLIAKGTSHWTIAILEDLKEKARKIHLGDLRWVLRTAMPLKSDFKVILNGERITSSKEDLEVIVSFDLSTLPTERLANIRKRTGQEWRLEGDKLLSDSFSSGITASILMTMKTLTGKSDDLARSFGFFVRVRDRLVNDSDPLFGLNALEHGYFSRFRADIQADDLDIVLKASRETIEESAIKTAFRSVLIEVFYEATTRYNEATKPPSTKGKKERDVISVPPKLIDYVVADVLADPQNGNGSEANNKWFYINVPEDVDISGLVTRLYTERQKYKYEYTQVGTSARLVSFDPSSATFWLNRDHELVQEYVNDARSKILLEEFVTAEALLEVYLREANMPSHIIGSVLERRDALFRNLVRDHMYSPEMVARSLREAYNDEFRLEVALVVAARTLGFVANHVSGSSEPDGLARFHDYSEGIATITLEAKSSGGTPSLSQLDFSGLREHMLNYEAAGCLLVAPSYPGDAEDGEVAVDRRSRDGKISCWTVELLAKLVEQAEARQIHARHVLDIVRNHFAPDDVERAVDDLLAKSVLIDAEVYRGVLRALRTLEENLVGEIQSVDTIMTTMALQSPVFRSIGRSNLERYLGTMSAASSGGMVLRGTTVVVNVVLDELERRLAHITKSPGGPRTVSGFRYDEKTG
jgi:hypothetical protein